MNVRQMPPARLPVSSHHLFPAALALWFGALFGLTSLAVRTALFEQALLSAGIDRFLPFATPPLGHPARLLLALGLALIGAVVGLVVAKIVVRGGGGVGHPAPVPPGDDGFRVRARDAHPDAPARRPVSARDELADAVPIPLPKKAALPEAEIADPVVVAPAPAAPAAPLVPPRLTAAERIARAHPSELSPVELMERLAIAMQRREARQDGNPAMTPEPRPDNDHAVADDERIATIESLRDTLAALRGTG